MTRIKLACSIIAAAAAASGCSVSDRLIAVAGTKYHVAALLSSRPPVAGQNITAFLLRRGEQSSQHLVYVRNREEPHLHRIHDLKVTILRGHGILWLEGRRITMRVGDMAIIAAGQPHYFVNQANKPAAVLADFSPPFDGTDRFQVSSPPP